jgi:predicted ATPase/class 3 adenylate cyclase
MAECRQCGIDNPAVAAFCMGCGSRLRAPLPRGDTRKSVTVVFCDVTGSTALAETLDPEALRSVMRRYFDDMRSALERHGGVVEKFIGDAVMAVFGLPQAHEDDALRAVRAAQEMREAVDRLHVELLAELGVEFAVRVGVNTGEVVAGDASRGQAIVTGDAVNVAARLEQHASPGEVLLGPATHRLVRDHVTVEPVGPLDLKGKSEGVMAFRLGAVADPASPGRRPAGAALVGRQEELGLLHEALRRATERRTCQAVTLLAPPGTGKSRLVDELLNALPGLARGFRGRCLPYGEGITYFPVGQIVREAAGLRDFEPADRAQERVRALLRRDDQQELVVSRILQLLGIGDAASPEDMLWAVRRFVEALAHEQPLVLVVEDLHWAEPTLLDLLEHISQWSQDSPLLLLSTARPELLDVRPGWGSSATGASLLRLEPLSVAESDQLVAALLGGPDLPETVRELVTRASGGTPLFVEEMVAMMVDDGLLRRTDEGWVPAADLAAVGPPPSVAALLAARLDRLSEEERRVLDAGSVIGEEFLVGAVRELVPEALRPAALTHLMSMVRKELLRPDRTRSSSADAFRFRHELVREAAYDALPKQLRAELHELVATWMEHIAGDRIAEQQEIVGYHLEQAHRYRTELRPSDPAAVELGIRAGRALAASGRRAAARGDARAAANLLGRARRLFPSGSPEGLALLPQLSEALTESGGSTEAVRLLDAGLEQARESGDERLVAHLELAALSHEQDAVWDTRVTQLVPRALAVFDRFDDEQGAITATRTLGDAAWVRGEVQEAVDLWRRCEALALRAGDTSEAAHLRAWILTAHYFGEDPAPRVLELAAESSEVVDLVPAARAGSLYTVAGARAMLGDLDRAEAAYAASAALQERLGRALSNLHFGSQVQADVYRFCNRPADEVTVLRDGVNAFEELAQETNGLLRSRLAEALSRVGADDEALAEADTALADGPRFFCVQALQARAVVLARRGHTEHALDAAHQALEILEPTGFFWLTAMNHTTLAFVHRSAGNLREARTSALAALERYEAKQIKHLTSEARQTLAELGS